MNLEDQVVNLELSKRLKEFDVEQKSIFVWEYYDDQCYTVKYIPYAVVPNNYNKFQLYSAFTVSELLNILPHLIVIDKEHEPFNSFRFNMFKSFIIKDMNEPDKLLKSDLYIANYECDSTECTGQEAWMRRQLLKNNRDKNSANCLAKLLAELIENKFIEVKNE